MILYILLGSASAPVPSEMSSQRSEKAVLMTPLTGGTPGGSLVAADEAAVWVALAAVAAGLAEVWAIAAVVLAAIKSIKKPFFIGYFSSITS